MVEWLQKAAREWARYDAALWFVSQSPREFLASMQGHAAAEESHRRTIVDQCSTIQCYRTPGVEPETLEQLGLNRTQIEFIKRKATPGKADIGHSECLTKHDDYQSWIPTYVAASPFEDAMFQYSSREHGDYAEYSDRFWGITDAGNSASETGKTTGSRGMLSTNGESEPGSEARKSGGRDSVTTDTAADGPQST